MIEILPKIIKNKRNKKYTEKRNPYKTYLNANWTWEKIFNEIDEIKENNNNFIQVTSIKYGIKYDTLVHKYNLYCKDKDKHFDKENRGGNNKIFTLTEENELYEYIKTNFIDTNKPLNNNIIKEIDLDKFKRKNNNMSFNASNGWCNIFKKRWNLSSQKVKASKIAKNIPSEYDINLFLDKCEKLKSEVKKNFSLITMKHVIILQILQKRRLE